jgi:phytoene/squalene synthetase
MFWPHEIWGQYGSSLEDFKQPGNRRAAVQCLNHLVRGRERECCACQRAQFLVGRMVWAASGTRYAPRHAGCASALNQVL